MTVRVSAVIVTSGKVEVLRGQRGFALDLRSCRGEEIDVHGMMKTSWAEITTDIARQIGAGIAGVGTRVRVWGRHVRRRESRVGRGRGHGLRWRRHHLVHLVEVIHLVHLVHLHLIHVVDLLERGVMLSVVEKTGLGSGGGGGGSSGMLLVASARIGVVVYSRVTSEFIGSAEALCASGKLACVGLLARVSANMPGLVLEAVECLVAERTLVGARKVGTVVLVLGLHCMRHGGYGCSSGGHRWIGLYSGVDVRRCWGIGS